MADDSTERYTTNNTDGYESSDSSVDPMEVDSITPKIKHKLDPDLANLQKVDIFIQQLPYFGQIKSTAFKTFENIKQNLAESIALNELRPGFSHWTNQLIIFIHEYGLFFTKEDHLKLIKLYIDVMLTPNIDLPTVDYCFGALTELLKYFL